MFGGLFKKNDAMSHAPRGSSHPSQVFNLPPKKVIKATKSYIARYAQEISFKEGDFFYVIGDNHSTYYEVINPIARMRGLVPIQYFESVDKNDLRTSQCQYVARKETTSTPTSPVNHEELDYDEPHLTLSHPPPPRFSESNSKCRVNSDGNLPGPTTIERIYIPRTEMVSGQGIIFTIMAEWTNMHKHVLKRTYDEFWALQVALLNYFPSESGRLDSPRILPFLTPPNQCSDPNIVASLSAYLRELIQLPIKIRSSLPIKKFFSLREGDVDTMIDLKFDSSESLIDLITDYTDAHIRKIKLFYQDDVLVILLEEPCSYEQLMALVCEKIGLKSCILLYEDECKEKIRLHGQSDWHVLFTTGPQKLLFHVRE